MNTTIQIVNRLMSGVFIVRRIDIHAVSIILNDEFGQQSNAVPGIMLSRSGKIITGNRAGRMGSMPMSVI
jgi:hypothetical protein